MSFINEELISILKRKTPEKENTVYLLMDIIPIGKEAAYRRLRGEIPFTLSEAAAICKKLNVSLDKIIGSKKENDYTFQISPVFIKSPFEEYRKIMKEVEEGINIIKEDPKGISYRASNKLPVEFAVKYDYLSRVYLYLVHYQLYPDSTPKKLTEFDIPHSLKAAENKIASLMSETDSIIILSNHIFSEYISIIKYLQNLDTISKEEISLLKKQLHMMLNDMEECASTGRYLSGKKAYIYVSHISFDSSYTYVEGSDYQASFLGVYYINQLHCSNRTICNTHKSWIKSLTRYSTLISVSGELQRGKYFLRQREIINSLSE